MRSLKLSSANEGGFFFVFGVLLVCTASLLWVSCDDTIYLDLIADPLVEKDIVEKVLSRPLPEGFAFAGGKAETGEIAVIVEVFDWTGRRQSAPHGLSKTLERSWYVPVVPFSSTVFDVAELDPDATYTLEPLNEVALPNRGLAVSGRYPGEEGYPYYSDTVVYLKVEGRHSGKESVMQALAGWIDSLSTTIDDPQFLWFAAVGDIMPGRGVPALLAAENGLDAVFSDTLPYLQQANVLAGNLEGAVTLRARRTEKSFTFRFAPEVLSSLKKAGFDYLSLTNNHSYDYGEIGFLDTLAALKSENIETSGAGIDPQNAAAPSVFSFQAGEIKVLSIGAYPPERNGFNGMENAAVSDTRPGILWANANGLQTVEAAFSEDSFDVLMVHGGTEWTTAPTAEQRDLYRRFVDLGADAVIGSHPHYLHGLEAYNGGLIAYSLGNFIFPGMQETAFGEESMILLLAIAGGEIRYVRMVPVRIDGTRLSVDTSGEILTHVFQRTAALQ